MIILLIPLLLLELYLSLKVGEHIGFFWSALWIVVTIILGVRLLQHSPFAVISNFNALSKGQISIKHFETAATLYMAGAILLLIPGVLSDFIGLLLLLYAFYLQITAKMKPIQQNPYYHQGEEDAQDVIDVEIIDEHTHHHDHT